jgi:hypothetical protein
VVKSVRIDDISELSLVPLISVYSMLSSYQVAARLSLTTF